jgi:hypothetical protein
MNNLRDASMMSAVAGVLALTFATQTCADEMLVIDPVSGEATFVTEAASEAFLRDQQSGIAISGHPINLDEPTSALSVDIVEVSVVHPTTGETVSLADIDVASLSEGDRRFIGDQLFFQGMQLDQEE